MAEQPLLLVVHRDRAFGSGLERELTVRFAAAGYQARHIASAMQATALISRLAEREAPLALVITDQRISPERDLGIDGRSLIASVRDLHPGAKTVLLIRPEERESATEALNAGDLDDFLVQPLREYGEQLVPLVSDLLADWSRRAEEVQRGVRVIGDVGAPETSDLCEFLDHNFVHHRSLDPERSTEARGLLEDSSRFSLPVVVLKDGTSLVQPTVLELAQALGLQTDTRQSAYDLAIVGGGPAGLAAAVYGASEGFDTVLIERFAPGGQAGQSSRIENYLGFPAGLSGSDLARRALWQAHKFEAEIVRPREIVGLEPRNGCLNLDVRDHMPLECRAVLIACGVDYRRLSVEGIDRYVGRGVGYGAAATDARHLAGRRVSVVGGANSAGQAALHFAKYATDVQILCRGSSLSKGMSHYLSERIRRNHKIQARMGTQVVALHGKDRLEAIDVATDGGAPERVPTDALFIMIGAVPRTNWLPGAIRRDEHGFVLSGRDLLEQAREDWPLDRDPYPLETSVPGVFAAGDARHGSSKRVASAVGEGAMAVQLIHQYLASAAERLPDNA
jgi:thioredoxin reductase (NADPH)